jgi:hypothetical protein
MEIMQIYYSMKLGSSFATQRQTVFEDLVIARSAIQTSAIHDRC